MTIDIGDRVEVRKFALLSGLPLRTQAVWVPGRVVMVDDYAIGVEFADGKTQIVTDSEWRKVA